MTQQKTCTSATATLEHPQLPKLAGPDILHDPYLLPFGLLVAYAFYLYFKDIFDPRPLCPVDFWANDNHIRKAKARVLERRAAADCSDVAYQLGNVPIVDAVTSILSFGQPKADEVSVHNHLIHENLKQGFPQVILDLEYPTQTSLFVPLAQELGYKAEDIHLFVPGEKESGIWNPCHSAIGSRALEMAATFQENACKKDAKSGDISTTACRVLMAAILSIARHLPSEKDSVLGCHAILGLCDLPTRLREQRERLENINPWDFAVLGHYLKACGSDKAASSIGEAARNLFNPFCHPEILPSVTGKTSFPLHLEGKKLLIIGCTLKHQTAVLPLLMALLNQVVEENSVPERQTPLQVAINGLHKVRYPSLIAHINERRMYGILFNLAAPNIDVLESHLAPEELKFLIYGIGNRIWSNPFSRADLRFLSCLLEPWTDSISILRKLRRGMSIVLSDEICSEPRERKPWKTKIKFDPISVKRLKCAKQQWAAIRAKLIEASLQQPFDATLQASVRNAVNELLPEPELSRQDS